jgi:hypothetical protein
MNKKTKQNQAISSNLSMISSAKMWQCFSIFYADKYAVYESA